MTNAGTNGPTPEDLQRDAANWVLRITSGHASKAELAELEAWCAQSAGHADAFARVSGKWRALGSVLESLDAPGQRQADSVPRRHGLARRAFLGGALAASAAGAAVLIARPPYELWPSLQEFASDYRTQAGEQRRIDLATDLSVEMNTRTSLNIRSEPARERIELVAGEASIASRNVPIELAAGIGVTRFNAARINIRRDGAAVCVSCLSGKAAVQWGGQSLELTAGKQVTYADMSIGASLDADTAAVSRWLNGDIFFHNEPLAGVIDEVNRYRSGRIVLMNAELGQRRFTARLKVDRLEMVFAQLEAVIGAKITHLPGGVVLVS